MSISEELGGRREILLRQGPIRYGERGKGEPIVFVHPMVVNGDLWRKVVPRLAPSFRCITPDWPLGGHSAPMTPGADLSPSGVAAIIADFLEALDLEGVTLVGNDTGGALAQIVVTERPERIGRLCLITCDAFDNFPPRLAKPLVWLARVAPLLVLAGHLARLRPLQRLPFTFGWLTKRPIEPAFVDSYLMPSLTNPAVRRDGAKALRGLAPRHTLEAARKLPGVAAPTLVAWNPEDHFFPLEHARRLVELIPNARLAEIEDSYTFVPEDQPERLADEIARLMEEPPAKGSPDAPNPLRSLLGRGARLGAVP